jgi:signal transduction histidine kinase
LLKDNFLRFKPAVEQKKLRFKLELSVNHFHAYVDQEALNKILSNLLNNAIKYSAGKVYVCLLPLQEGVSSFSIQIKNDGFIIPPELKEKIFETFYRIEETANESGTGIGLSLARSLTELHKGRLELKDSENNLNIFQLTLPVRQEIEFNLSLRKKI